MKFDDCQSSSLDCFENLKIVFFLWKIDIQHYIERVTKDKNNNGLRTQVGQEWEKLMQNLPLLLNRVRDENIFLETTLEKILQTNPRNK